MSATRKKGGLSAVWWGATSGAGDFMTGVGEMPRTASDLTSYAIYAGVAIAGLVLIMIAYSFASGKQSFGDVARAVRPI